MNENQIAKEVVDAVVKIHIKLGSGLLESVYETVLGRELEKRGLRVERERYYRGLADQLRQEADLGTSFTQLWRAVGSIDGLNRHLDAIADSHIAKRFPALWLWNAGELLLDPAAVDRFVDLARRYHVKQVYCHLPADQPLADDELLAERLTIFINRCAAEHIGVWALLGEPDWLQGSGLDYFRRAVDDVVAYNRRFGPFEPRLAGIKLGLQSDQSSTWDADSLAQQEGAARLLELARQARAALPPDLSLWIDCPSMLFSPANRHWAEELLTLSDGLTLLCAQREPEWILRTTDEILSDWPGLLEVGLELGPDQLAPAAVRALIDRLVAAHGSDSGFVGVALHDWSRLRGRQEADAP
ncbi:MAG: GxxExxY protein [Planctomycetota bacterium]